MVRKIRNVIVLILLSLAVYFAYLSYMEYQPIIKSKVQKEAVKEIAVIDSNDPYNRIINFDALKSINEDIVGWLYIPGTSIDYPVVIGDTNEEYLNKDIDGNWSELGSIFTFEDTSKNLYDANIFLFGHNMINYQMFGELKRYLDEEFRNEHLKMYVYTETRTMELEVFSIFTCLRNDDIFDNVGLELGTPEYLDVLIDMENRNVYPELGVENINNCYDKRTFSLVTCHGDVGTVYRLVVNGIVKQEKLTDWIKQKE